MSKPPPHQPEPPSRLQTAIQRLSIGILALFLLIALARVIPDFMQGLSAGLSGN